MLAFHHFLKAAHGVGHFHVLALAAGERLGHREGLREELLNLAGARDGGFVFIRKFVDTQNRDDVLQILVALKGQFHCLRDVVMFLHR